MEIVNELLNTYRNDPRGRRMLLSTPSQARGLTHAPLPLLTVGLRYANPTYLGLPFP